MKIIIINLFAIHYYTLSHDRVVFSCMWANRPVCYIRRSRHNTSLPYMSGWLLIIQKRPHWCVASLCNATSQHAWTHNLCS